MEVILKKDLVGWGHKNDQIKVKAGFANNYLIPRSLAMVANATNKKVAQENIRQAAHKIAQRKQAAEALATRMAELTVELKAKAGDSGKIFGSVTTIQLAEALKAHEIEIDRKQIQFTKPVKELGTHEATIALHKEVVQTLSFKVTAA